MHGKRQSAVVAGDERSLPDAPPIEPDRAPASHPEFLSLAAILDDWRRAERAPDEIGEEDPRRAEVVALVEHLRLQYHFEAKVRAERVDTRFSGEPL
jgi:hypothetical protein